MSDDQNRNLPASGRKIAKARREGQVARSRDLGHLATLGAGSLLLVALAPSLVAAMRVRLAEGLRFDAQVLAEPASMLERLAALALQMLVLVGPLGAAVLAAALLAGKLAGGWNFTLKPLMPKFSKLDPVSGLKRLVSAHQLVETLKACVLAAVLGVTGALFVRAQLESFTGLLAQPLPTALASTGTLLRDGLVAMLVAVALFAVVDVPLQRWRLLRQLRMSREEAKQEVKEVEGNVEVKGRIRARMRQLAARRMLAAVPQADLVVMNPTHYAVALEYDEATMSAPRVIAKGADLLALRIRDLAEEHRVPVLQAPPLARALYAHAEVDQEIPAVLFSAVAQVLAWVYQLRAAVRPGAAPLPPPQPEVPPELDPHQGGAPRRRRLER